MRLTLELNLLESCRVRLKAYQLGLLRLLGSYGYTKVIRVVLCRVFKPAINQSLLLDSRLSVEMAVKVIATGVASVVNS